MALKRPDHKASFRSGTILGFDSQGLIMTIEFERVELGFHGFFEGIFDGFQHTGQELTPIFLDFFSIRGFEFQGHGWDMPLISSKVAEGTGIKGVVHNPIIIGLF